MLYTPPKLYVVVPCFNEEDVITQTLNRLLHKLHTMIESTLIAPQSAIVCIDDGSSDGTWQQVNQFSPPPTCAKSKESSLSLISLKLSRNFGH
ncbi:glycosyltransferase [Helicobacter typhlonius]|uniref:glycosyltransferase family 2 protein n=1 Tax=Helicobacter typhlonius TaxID=76936 RepID=UPI002FDF94F4